MSQNISCAPPDLLQWKHIFMSQHHARSLWQDWYATISLELVLHHHHPDSGAGGQHPASADFFLMVITSIVFIFLSTFTTYLLLRVMGIAKPTWTVNMVEQ